MRASVIIPTWRRPDDLRRCLEGLSVQTRQPDEVIVVHRRDDDETVALLESMRDERAVAVDAPGLVAALNAGLRSARSDLICFLDDDTVPHPSWLECIESHFAADPRVGGVGGRDFINDRRGEAEGSPTVGRIRWYGRVVGNHHRGVGPPRRVDVLKGCNMSYRRDAVEGLSFDSRLLGEGDQPCSELRFGASVRRRGWRLIYDPAVSVDHFPAPKSKYDSVRQTRDRRTVTKHAFNHTLGVLESVPLWHRIAYMAWSVLVGQPGSPGIMNVVRSLRSGNIRAPMLFRVALRARLQAYRVWSADRRSA